MKDVSLSINNLAIDLTIVYATETSSKMALTLSQNFVYFVLYDFVQSSPVCGPNTYQIMYGETSDFRCQRQ